MGARTVLATMTVTAAMAFAHVAAAQDASYLPAVQVSVALKEYAVTPQEVVVPKSRMVNLVVTNGGTAAHNLEVSVPMAKVKFEAPLAPGERKVLSFRAPDETGSYDIYSPESRDRGMAAKLVVR
ncbi:MAG: cupredoxin domain-containing protein [Rhodospirillaceae bacterium]